MIVNLRDAEIKELVDNMLAGFSGDEIIDWFEQLGYEFEDIQELKDYVEDFKES